MPTSSYYKTIQDCPVTKTTSNILYPYITEKTDPWYKAYGGYNSGVDIECDFVYSICPCKVVYTGVGESNVDKVVIVQYSSTTCFRYSHLDSISVSQNDLLTTGAYIGHTNKYCKFEFLYDIQVYSLWVVRVLNKQYYPEDPEEYVDGTITLLGSGLVNPNDSDVNIDNNPDDEIPLSTIIFYGDGYE